MGPTVFKHFYFSIGVEIGQYCFLRQNLFRLSRIYQSSVLKQSNTVAKHGGMIEVVKGNQHRKAEFPDERKDFQLATDIKMICRLVQNENTRFLCLCTGDMDALFFTA